MLNASLIAGLRESEFWLMDPGELFRFLKAYNERRKIDTQTQAALLYNLADLIGLSVGRMLVKQCKFPRIEQAFPSLFDYDPEEERTQRSINNFIRFAEQFNSRRGEPNGNN